MHEAKSQLSMLISKYVQHGTTVIVANAGKPVAKLIAFEPHQPSRIGFMAGQMRLPSAQVFNDIGSEEIASMFGGDE
jgi:antitoxin (DNA-binding transcriptional repressor) of toxin-antitoxin stability system